MEDSKHIAEKLLDRYLSGTCTERERMLVEQAYNKFATDEKVPSGNIDIDRIAKQSWQEITQIIQLDPKPRVWFWKPLIVAASIVCCIGLGIFYYVSSSRETTSGNDIDPGKNVAFLTLSDGKKIALDQAANGQLAKQDDITITKTSDGKLIYTVNPKQANLQGDAFNTIETPRGGQFQLTLPDGSKVWLNAASSLKYNLALNSLKPRKVELQGEAYFEVSHDKTRPFTVVTKSGSVQVLGTHFNINSYSDEKSEQTTLVEGSVKVHSDLGHSDKLLIPGEQSLINETGAIKVSKADIEATLAWKNGLFMFEDESLKSIMQKVSRWYDIEVVYQDVDSEQTFGGSVSRYDKISKVLSKLEKVGGVKFKIDGRRVIVTK
jgi:transmembrane sensor